MDYARIADKDLISGDYKSTIKYSGQGVEMIVNLT
jgi:hypothetical protein